MNLHIAALGIGFILDLMFGDPRWMIHPVCLMGKTISWAEKTVRRIAKDEKKKLLAGSVFLCAGNVIFWTGLSWLLCSLLYKAGPGVGLAGESFLCYQLLAVKGLKSESMKVYQALRYGTIEEARHAVSMIVGRDTQDLDNAGVTKAAVETVAENLSDGVIAPLLFMAVGGAPLGYFYKAVNTMDSMVGYKDEKYLYIGRIPAKLDDVLNYIPARISALLMILTAPLAGLNGKDAFRIWRRDGRNHASPNSAQTEAAAAGALGVQLAGDAYYFGKLYKKLTIGDKKREIEIEDIKRINRLLYITSAAAMLIVLAVGI
ncbi:cobalamin biosynthesis protein CobD [Clostridium sp. chh4-2]|uniref:adenosylcobinamide-phosphate synthase CbiB n=1 Tax=Clostridium sp. chh4-2 TaxID=2067550 RepID=UPI000CCF236E|nr:adenosylcobinamide-phosphate synthase CbiB [Clostridium sp. chh4-2]PNV59911.1 cobalamin biosynthesis protein CobD [Clostridium sp. chh4-2]